MLFQVVVLHYLFFCLAVFESFMHSCADCSLQIPPQFADFVIPAEHDALLLLPQTTFSRNRLSKIGNTDSRSERTFMTESCLEGSPVRLLYRKRFLDEREVELNCLKVINKK